MLIFEALVEIGRIRLFGIKARTQGLIAPVLLRRELDLHALFERQIEEAARCAKHRLDIGLRYAVLCQIEEPAAFARVPDLTGDLPLSLCRSLAKGQEIDDGHVSHQALQAISFASAKLCRAASA